MSSKKVLVAGATGLVGYAAMRHFAAEPGCEVLALSRRRPDETYGARWLPLNLSDKAACGALAGEFAGITHLVYAALYEQPGLVAGWREEEQIRTNEAMLSNLFEPLHKAAKGLRHVALLQGTKAYGVHVRPLTVPARENRSEMHEQPNFYWNQERYIRGQQQGKAWSWTILRPVLIVGCSTGSAMNVVPALGVYAAMMRRAGKKTLDYPGGVGRVAQAGRCRPAGARHRLVGRGGDGAQRDLQRHQWRRVRVAQCVARHRRCAGLRRRRACAASARQGDPYARGGVGRDPPAARPGVRLARGLRRAFLRVRRLHHGLRRTQPGPPALVSTIKLMQAGFHEVMDTEAMFAKAVAELQARRLLPPR